MFASGTEKGLALNPSHGDFNYVPADGAGALKSINKGNKMFGGADRFEKPPDIGQVDYDLPSAFAPSKPSKAAFGSVESRDAKILGQSNDAPPPGHYGIPEAPEGPDMPSSAFASKTPQIPTLHPTDSPAPGSYDVAESLEIKSFNAAAPGFGSVEVRDAKILGQSNDAPGPGAYTIQQLDSNAKNKEGKKGSASFASGTEKGLALNPSYGQLDYMPTDGSGALKTINQGSKMFGGADRFEKERATFSPRPPAIYDTPGAFDDALKPEITVRRNKGFGGTESRDAKVHGQSDGSGLGPGHYFNADGEPYEA